MARPRRSKPSKIVNLKLSKAELCRFPHVQITHHARFVVKFKIQNMLPISNAGVPFGPNASTEVQTAPGTGASSGEENIQHDSMKRVMPTMESARHTDSYASHTAQSAGSPPTASLPTESHQMIIDPMYVPPRPAIGKTVRRASSSTEQFNLSTRTAYGEDTSKTLPRGAMTPPSEVQSGTSTYKTFPRGAMASPYEVQIDTNTSKTLPRGAMALPYQVQTSTSTPKTLLRGATISPYDVQTSTSTSKTSLGGAMAPPSEIPTGTSTSKTSLRGAMPSPYEVQTGTSTSKTLLRDATASPYEVQTGTLKSVGGPNKTVTKNVAGFVTDLPQDSDESFSAEDDGEVHEPQRPKLTTATPMPKDLVMPSTPNQSISNEFPEYLEAKRKWDEMDPKDRPRTRPPQDPATMTAAQRLRYDERMKRQAKIDKIDATHRNERDMRRDARKGTDPRSSNPPKDPTTMTDAERAQYTERKDRKRGIPGVSEGSNKRHKAKQRKAAWEEKQRRQGL